MVGSQAELRAELERVAAQLSPSTEWTLRVDALLRLEGLVKGGAAELPAFADLVSMLLRDALATQVRGVGRLCCSRLLVPPLAGSTSSLLSCKSC